MALLDQRVIDNWAIALSNIALEQNQAKAYVEQASVLVEILKDQDKFVAMLSAKNISDESGEMKAKIVDETFASFSFVPEILNMMKMLSQLGEFVYARDIFKKTRKILTQAAGLAYGVAWSTQSLDAKTLTALEKKIGTILNHKVKLVNKLDLDLIGGVQVVIENRIFDGSIKGKLDKIRYEIMENTKNSEGVE